MTATLDWFGCATFRLKTHGFTIFLDAYIDRVPGADGPPGASAANIDTCDYILVGHSHFDHLWGADQIALRTGCKVIGSYETVRILASAGVPKKQLLPVSGGETVPLGDDITVEVYPALHSCLWAGYDDNDPDFECLGDTHIDYFVRRQNEKEVISGLGKLSSDLRVHMQRSDQGCRGDGGTLCFVIDMPEGRLFFKDTPGHWSGIMEKIEADVGILAASGRANVDGEPIQGSLNDFLISEAQLLNLKRVILCHHDAWLGPIFPAVNIAEICDRFAVEQPSCDVLELGYVDAFTVFNGLATVSSRGGVSPILL